MASIRNQLLGYLEQFANDDARLIEKLHALTAQQVTVAQGEKKHRIGLAFSKSTQGWQIQMVVVIVGNQHEIYRRQILEFKSWLDITLRAHSRHRAGAV